MMARPDCGSCVAAPVACREGDNPASSAEEAEAFASPYSGIYFMTLILKEGGLAVKAGSIDDAPAFSALG